MWSVLSPEAPHSKQRESDHGIPEERTLQTLPTIFLYDCTTEKQCFALHLYFADTLMDTASRFKSNLCLAQYR